MTAPVPSIAHVDANEAVRVTRSVVLERGVTSLRQRPVDAWLTLATKLNLDLTPWPLIDCGKRDVVLVVKNLYAAWFALVDDALDRAGSTRELLSSAALILSADPPRREPAEELLDEILTRARAIADDIGPLRVALWELLTSLYYEHLCGTHRGSADRDWFLSHRVTTFGLGPGFAIDMAAASGSLDERQLEKADRAYRELASALRYSADAGSLTRHRRHGAPNILDVWRDGATDDDLRARAAAIANDHLERARAIAGGDDVPGLLDLIEAGAGFAARLRDTDVFAPDGDG